MSKWVRGTKTLARRRNRRTTINVTAFRRAVVESLEVRRLLAVTATDDNFIVNEDGSVFIPDLVVLANDTAKPPPTR